MDRVETIVIGGGVIGLAIAASLARDGSEVLVLEKSPGVGQGISSRNSEVIHAGIYYAADSLKARLCVEGKHRLYQYCAERNIPHQKVGKLIVATDLGEEVQLEEIASKAQTNGVVDLVQVSMQQINKLEPEVSSKAGLLSPSTGIVSAHDLINSLVGDITNFGGQIAVHTEVEHITRQSSVFEVTCSIKGEGYQIGSDRLINAAGLSAQQVARHSEFLPSVVNVPKLHLCRGVYFSYSGKSPFERLIYPVPEKNSVGLGIHATLDLGSQVKFGPDAEYIQDEEYRLPNVIPDRYINAIRRYYPGLDVSKLSPGYVGIRPKLSADGESARDFCIEGPEQHGIEGYVQLFGIESPGLTASLAIGQYVRDQIATIAS
ncbi:MAG: L-2-hydroxyglutarate oxidase LhgO [Patiriisocius sp.]|jgi:L-2-hydroxyglutarate oxidase LhgO